MQHMQKEWRGVSKNWCGKDVRLRTARVQRGPWSRADLHLLARMHWRAKVTAARGIDWLIKAGVLLISASCPINQRRRGGEREKNAMFYLLVHERSPRLSPTAFKRTRDNSVKSRDW